MQYSVSAEYCIKVNFSPTIVLSPQLYFLYLSRYLILNRFCCIICSHATSDRNTEAIQDSPNLFGPVYAFHYLYDRLFHLIMQISFIQLTFTVFEILVLCVFHQQCCKKPLPAYGALTDRVRSFQNQLPHHLLLPEPVPGSDYS